jgi:hypothetical protein
MCERVNKSMKQTCFDTAMRRKLYTNLASLQEDLASWLRDYHYEWPHSGKYCYGKPPRQTFEDSKQLTLEKSNELLYLNLKKTTNTPYVTDKKSYNDTCCKIKSCLAQGHKIFFTSLTTLQRHAISISQYSTVANLRV